MILGCCPMRSNSNNNLLGSPHLRALQGLFIYFVSTKAKMTKLLIISSFILLTSNLLVAQDKDLLVKNIRLKYSEIRANIDLYDTILVQTEGSQTTAYYDNGDLRLIEVIWFGEIGKNQIEYYINDGELIFAFDQDFDYNRPIYWDEETAKENGDNEAFDPNKTKVKGDRYYFNDEKLFLWIDNDKQEQDLTMGTNSIVGKGLVAHCNKMKGELKE